MVGRALARQCQDALDELTLLAPWTELLSAQNSPEDFPDLDKIPTLRELATLDANAPAGNRPSAQLCRHVGGKRLAWRTATLITEASQQRQSKDRGYRSGWPCNAANSPGWSMTSCSTRRVICWLSGTTSASAGGTRVTTICWLRKPDCAAFVAIAQGQLPQESWFALGRLLTTAGGEPVLLSWSGSMFEYLMPLLVMPTYENTLLDQTCKAAVARQIEYGKKRGVPWGISESGYNAIDVHLNYQYRAFGVPGLGLKRGLAEDLVVAPYASALALMVAPEEACLNLQRLAAEGSKASTASMKRSTTRLRVCRAGNRAPWSAPSWRITRA